MDRLFTFLLLLLLVSRSSGRFWHTMHVGMAGSAGSVYHAHLMKWLILLLVFWLLWRLLRPVRSPLRTAARSHAGETMRACAHCGLNVPKSEAVSDGGADYCSEAHRRLGPAHEDS